MLTVQKSTENDLRVGAAYIRVSTHDQDELSPDAQKRLLLDYAKANGIVVPAENIFEESVSGRNVKKRKEFQRMIALAKSPDHPFDVILVWKFSRFARNQEESIVYKSMLRKDNVEVLSISEPVVDGPFGSLIERIIEWMDEYYSIRLSGEVLRGMSEKALKEGYQTTPPLGYKAVGGGKPFVIDEEEFKIVSFIMSQYDEYSLDATAIARKCNALGYRTKRGNPFERRNIDYILRNPFYSGTVVWNGHSFEGAHEVRYTKEQLNERLRLMNARKRPSGHRNVSACRHWLSGLIRCSVCGATMSYSGNLGCPSFQCWKYSKGMHPGSSSISVKKMERLVLKYFEDILNGRDFDYKVKVIPSRETEELKELRRELARLDVREQRIRMAYENEIDTLEEYRENKARLKRRRESLKAEIASMEKEAAAPPTRQEVLKQIETVYNLLKDPDASFEMKGVFIRTVVDKIVFDRTSGELVFDISVS